MSADFSDDKKYRWRLRRTMENPVGGNVVFCGVNPSTAGAKVNDATITRLINFTGLWGYGSFSIVNAFSLVSASPKTLAEVVDPIGRETDYWLREEFNNADLIVPMWGAIEKVPPHLRYRFDTVRRLIRDTGYGCKVFGLTKNGHPMHPLYLGRDTQLKDWTP